MSDIEDAIAVMQLRTDKQPYAYFKALEFYYLISSYKSVFLCLRNHLSALKWVSKSMLNGHTY